MVKRDTITPETIAGVAAQYAGHPLDAARAAAYAAALEPLLAQIVTLRDLPLKDVEPATVFAPLEVPKR